jgi:allantoicase
VTGQVRLDIYPDGGMARLRVLGRPTAAAREALADRFLRLLPESQLAGLLQAGGLPAGGLDVLDGLLPEVRALFRLSLSTLR